MKLSTVGVTMTATMLLGAMIPANSVAAKSRVKVIKTSKLTPRVRYSNGGNIYSSRYLTRLRIKGLTIHIPSGQPVMRSRLRRAMAIQPSITTFTPSTINLRVND